MNRMRRSPLTIAAMAFALAAGALHIGPKHIRAQDLAEELKGLSVSGR